ncbi:MAG: hypothetical protein WBF26_05730, partial [Candidatus Sulfotelmatobacter sp.]
GGVAGPLRAQMVHSCLDAVEAIVVQATRTKGQAHSGPKWPANLILGEAAHSTVTEAETVGGTESNAKRDSRSKRKSAVRLSGVRSSGRPGRAPAATGRSALSAG